MSELTKNVKENIVARHLDDPAGRYACYPSIMQFEQGFGDSGFVDAVRISNGDPIPRRLSLHVGVPDHFGLYPVENRIKVEQVDRSKAGAYLGRLVRQIAAIGCIFDRDRDVVQLSLSPGTTQFFDIDQIAEVVESISRNFHVISTSKRDFSVTIDPCDTRHGDLSALVEIGCNRVNFAFPRTGVSGGGTPMSVDAEPRGVVEACRSAGFRNVRIDLVYGGAHSKRDIFANTLNAALDAKADRIALRDCAHLPESFGSGSEQSLGTQDRASMLVDAYKALLDAGFIHVGMDVFATKDDPLLVAKRQGRLYRDALGFGTHGETDMVGFGVGAIQQIGGAYCRAMPYLREWGAAIDSGSYGIQSGIRLSEDDIARSAVIQSLTCQGFVDINSVENMFGIDFNKYFCEEIDRLGLLVVDGLLVIESGMLVLTPAGRLLSRAVSSCFDDYLHRTLEGAVTFRSQW